MNELDSRYVGSVTATWAKKIFLVNQGYFTNQLISGKLRQIKFKISNIWRSNVYSNPFC